MGEVVMLLRISRPPTLVRPGKIRTAAFLFTGLRIVNTAFQFATVRALHALAPALINPEDSDEISSRGGPRATLQVCFQEPRTYCAWFDATPFGNGACGRNLFLAKDGSELHDRERGASRWTLQQSWLLLGRSKSQEFPRQ